MLLLFEVENYKSFREKASLSMTAAPGSQPSFFTSWFLQLALANGGVPL